MKTPLVDNKHIYYCQIILGDELTFVDSVDDLELIGIHHILRVKYIHNKGNLSQREMYKYCNAFDEETQKKVDYVYNNILDKKYLNKMIKSIIDKSESARKSVSKRISNDITNDITKDVSNDITKDVSNVNDNVNVNEKEKEKEKEEEKGEGEKFSFTLKSIKSFDQLSEDYVSRLKTEIENHNEKLYFKRLQVNSPLSELLTFEEFSNKFLANGKKQKDFWRTFLVYEKYTFENEAKRKGL